MSKKRDEILIGDWVSVTKVGIKGVYQVLDIKDEIYYLEQPDGGYTHKMKATIGELIK